MSEGAFDPASREALYRIIEARRDIRSYRPEPVPAEVLRRILHAAHMAPSVGFMQPWNFLFIESPELRSKLHAHYVEVVTAARAHYEGDRGQRIASLKLQGILDAPHNLLITCDTTRGGAQVLGRWVQPETDVYSTCLAVQNLWLAARAEGVGVGWMSIATPEFLQELFGLPKHVVPVAYLTMGWPIDVPDEPLLQRVGWRKRLDLDDLIFRDRWQQPANLPSAPESTPLRPDAPVEPLPASTARNADLTRPPGSLGRLEEVALQLGGIQQGVYPRARDRRLLLFAGDHGVTAEGVSAYRPEVTARMVYQFVAGAAAVNALAREVGIEVVVVDVGVDHDFEGATGLQHRKVGRGTANLAIGPAMSVEDCAAAIAAGAASVSDLGPTDLLAVGEMGIGNSTAAAALAAALTGMPVVDMVGRGTGVGPRTKAHKVAVVERALALHGAALADPTEALRRVGGYELAALVGAIEAAAERRVMVVLDGFITGAAALCAARRTPSVLPFLVAGHRSREPGHAAVLDALGIEPLLDLDLALGEGSGAALAMGLIGAACRCFTEMSTFAEAGIEHPEVESARE